MSRTHALILAAGVGQRMRSGGMPKQFIKLMGKPIVVYTLEKFQSCEEVDDIFIVCHNGYIELMQELVDLYKLNKVKQIIIGGEARQSSLQIGLNAIEDGGAADDDLIVIHDGVRPLVTENTIRENIRIAGSEGSAVTVHPVTESVVITDAHDAGMEDFKKRADTYSLTSPQTFRLGEIRDAFERVQKETPEIPLLDAAMVYAQAGGRVQLVKEQNNNFKITTPEDYYYLKAMLELEENRTVFGL